MTPEQTQKLIADIKKDPRARKQGKEWIRQQLKMWAAVASSKLPRRVSHHPGVLEEVIVCVRLSPPDQFIGELPQELVLRRLTEDDLEFVGTFSRLW